MTLPAYFEPTPDGALLGRNLRRPVRIESSLIEIANPGTRPVRIRFAGARRSTTVEGINEQSGRVNYLVGADRSKWRTGIHIYARAQTRDLYPRIDVEYYASDRQLEYDFVVHPGGDPWRIALDVDAAVALSPGGNLAIGRTGITQRRPTAYQQFGDDRRTVEAHYVVRDRKVHIEVGSYDRSRELIIDPVVVSTATFDGNGLDAPHDVAVGADGRSYVVGTTASTDFPVQHALRSSHQGGPCYYIEFYPSEPCRDGFLMKVAPEGTVEFATYFGGRYVDELNAVAIDGAGAIYAAGQSNSPDLPGNLPGEECTSNNPNQMCNFVAKFTPDGQSLAYSKVMGIRPIVDLAASVAGEAYAAELPYDDAFAWRVIAVSPDGSIVRPVYAAVRSSDRARRIAIGPSGDIYVAGDSYELTTKTTVGVVQTSRRDHAAWRVSQDGSREPIDAGIPITVDTRYSSYVVAHPARPGLLFLSNGRSDLLWRSIDGGATWVRVNTTGQWRIVPDPLNPDVVYNAFAQRSLDGGVTWQPLSSPGVLQRSFGLSRTTGVLYVGTDAGFFKSTDRGNSWQSLPTLNGYWIVAVDASSPARLYVTPIGGSGLFRTSDEGATLTPIASPGLLLATDPVHSSTLYAGASSSGSANGQVFKSTDDGNSWTTIIAGFEGTPFLTVHPTSSNTLALRLEISSWPLLATALRSNDGGATWTTVDSSGGASSVDFKPDDPTVLYVGKRGSTDTFVARITAAGILRYATLLGGWADDSVSDLSVDASDSAWVAGFSASDDFPYSVNPGRPPIGRPSRTFIAQVSPLGNAVPAAWSIGSPVAPQDAVDAGVEAAERIYAATCRYDAASVATRYSTCQTARYTRDGGMLGSSTAPSALFAVDGHGRQTFAALARFVPGPNPDPWWQLISAQGAVEITTYRWVTLSSLGASVASPSRFNIPITWTTTTTPTSGVEYSFWRFDASGGWTQVQPYGPSATYAWTPAYSDIGRHALQVWARPVGSTDQYEAWAGSEFTITAGALPKITALTASRALPTPAGSPVTWTTTTTTGAAPAQYQFWRRDADGWHMVRDYASANTYTWTPTTGDIGAHVIQAWVRNGDSPAAYEDYTAVMFDVRAPDPLTVTSLTANVALPSPAGASMVWTATTSGGIAPLRYKFWRLDADGWHMVQDYGASNVYTWTPGVTDIGAHAVQAWVRSAGSIAVYDAWTSVTFNIAGPAPLVVTALTADPSAPAAGTSITWTAAATGGFAPLQYKFWRLDADGWHMAQDYSAQTTYTWTPDAAQVGSHALQVWVRSAGSSAAYDNWRGVTFTVDPPPAIAMPAFSANVSFPATVGTPITWTATATGGAAPLQYQFWRLDGSGWSIVQPYSVTSTYTWTPGPGDAGTHAVQVWVRSWGSAALYEAWMSTGFFTINP
jgi:hypothetical protein